MFRAPGGHLSPSDHTVPRTQHHFPKVGPTLSGWLNHVVVIMQRRQRVASRALEEVIAPTGIATCLGETSTAQAGLLLLRRPTLCECRSMRRRTPPQRPDPES